MPTRPHKNNGKKLVVNFHFPLLPTHFLYKYILAVPDGSIGASFSLKTACGELPFSATSCNFSF